MTNTGWSYTPFDGGYLGFEDDSDDDPKSHRLGCQCEVCLQNHPEWEVLYGDDEPFCYTCVSSAYWLECESCDHDWIDNADSWDDEPASMCQWCNGHGGWWICLGIAHHDLDPGSIHSIPLDQRIDKTKANDGTTETAL